jgi:hypothetical protein
MTWLSSAVFLSAITRAVMAVSAPTPTASCTYTQVDTHYETSLTWSGLSVTSFVVSGSAGPLAQGQLAHPTRNGNLSLSLLGAPTSAQLNGSKSGVRVACTAG